MTESKRTRTTRIHRRAPAGRGTNAPHEAAFEQMLPRYYENRVIRHRMCEFLGRTEGRAATAAYIVGDDGRSEYCEPASPSRIAWLLDAGFEVERSLWDRDYLIADIDLEYENFDDPAAPWRDPERTFQLQKPVLDAALHILGQTGIVPLVLMSGRGFHLVWAVNRSSSAFDRLALLGYVPPSLAARYAQTCSPAGRPVEAPLGQAYAALGMILEFIGHRVLSACAADCAVPVQITSIEVGPGPRGREIVSFDLSEYGDPLDTRHIRLPFSVYLKPRRVEWALGETELHALLPIFEIPISGLPTSKALEISRGPAAAIGLARNSRTVIPDQSGPMERLLDEYEGSNLAEFHREFYRAAWDQMGGRASMPPLRNVPPCAE